MLTDREFRRFMRQHGDVMQWFEDYDRLGGKSPTRRTRLNLTISNKANYVLNQMQGKKSRIIEDLILAKSKKL
jgi:hypothetical protein